MSGLIQTDNRAWLVRTGSHENKFFFFFKNTFERKNEKKANVTISERCDLWREEKRAFQFLIIIESNGDCSIWKKKFPQSDNNDSHFLLSSQRPQTL